MPYTWKPDGHSYPLINTQTFQNLFFLISLGTFQIERLIFSITQNFRWEHFRQRTQHSRRSEVESRLCFGQEVNTLVLGICHRGSVTILFSANSALIWVPSMILLSSGQGYQATKVMGKFPSKQLISYCEDASLFFYFENGVKNSAEKRENIILCLTFIRRCMKSLFKGNLSCQLHTMPKSSSLANLSQRKGLGLIIFFG